MFESLELLDRALLLKINSFHTPLLDILMWQLSESWHSVVFILVLAFYFYKTNSRKKAIEIVLGCALVFACTDFSTNLIKHQVQRYRPTHNNDIKAQIHKVNNYEGGTFGFFSSHTANVFGFTMFLFLCLPKSSNKLKWLLFLYPLLIAYSRIYLGVHYPLDILFGLMWGVLFGFIMYKIMNSYFFKADA